jgi:hypothetical protein
MTGDKDEPSPDSALLHRAIERRDGRRLFDVLDDPLRRRVLYELDPADGPVALADLAERVADVEGGSAARPPSADGTTVADRVAVRLHHVHLPKLDEYELVEYDRRDKTVEASACR